MRHCISYPTFLSVVKYVNAYPAFNVHRLHFPRRLQSSAFRSKLKVFELRKIDSDEPT